MRSSIPVLPDTASLAGTWRLSVDGVDCDLRLEAIDMGLREPHAQAWRVIDADGCLPADVAVAGWRPAPDGIDMLRADGHSVFFLSRDGDVFLGPAPNGTRVRLSRR